MIKSEKAPAYVKGMTYINIKRNSVVETVDQFETRKEAYRAEYDYNLSDPSHNYYLSQRCTNDWRAEQ